jgi:hypothetical protein
MRILHALALGVVLVACGGSETAVTTPVKAGAEGDTPSATPPPASASPSVEGTTPTGTAGPTGAASASGAVTIWSVENVEQLVPAVPARRNAVGRPIPAIPAYEVARTTLAEVVDRHAADPENPWAIAHGLLARGKDWRLGDGRPALAHVFKVYAEPRSFARAGGAPARSLLGFPTSRGSIRVEPHTDLILKNAIEAGFAPEASFDSPAGKVTLADLYRATVLKTWLVAQKNHSSFKDPNDVVWGLQALAAWAPTGAGASKPELQWVAADGTPMDLDVLTSFSVAMLTQESAFLFEAMQKGTPFTRSGQNLFTYTCGGAHLVQGASYAVARGFGTELDRKAVLAQVPLMFYRLPNELRVYDEAMARNPKYRTRLLVQRVKFLGHWLESVSKMQAMGLFEPNAEQLRLIEGAAQNLSLVVDALAKQGTFQQVDTIRTKDEQLYLDIVGDSAHALHGLELAMGRAEVSW